MDVMRARVALRERSLLDVLDLAARFVFAHKKAYGRVALAVLAPAFLASWAFAEAAGWGWGWVDAIAIGAVVQAPFTALASRLVFADKVSTGEVLRASTRALPTLFGVRLVQAVAIALSIAFLLLPVLWIGTIMFFLVEVIVLEHAPAGTAFVRASRLSGTRFGDAMLAFLLTALIPFVPRGVLFRAIDMHRRARR